MGNVTKPAKLFEFAALLVKIGTETDKRSVFIGNWLWCLRDQVMAVPPRKSKRVGSAVTAPPPVPSPSPRGSPSKRARRTDDAQAARGVPSTSTMIATNTNKDRVSVSLSWSLVESWADHVAAAAKDRRQ